MIQLPHISESLDLFGTLFKIKEIKYPMQKAHIEAGDIYNLSNLIIHWPHTSSMTYLIADGLLPLVNHRN
jgi:thiamine pyrophosphokinase